MSFAVGQQRQLRAVSHPARVRLLSLLAAEPKSGSELAPEIGMTQAAVSYHLRQLADAGFIEVAETRSKRGGREKRYRLTDLRGADGTNADVLANASAIAADVQRRIITDQPSTWDLVGDLDTWVDADAWRRCVNAIGDAITELHDAATAPRTPGAIQVSATALMFRSAA